MISETISNENKTWHHVKKLLEMGYATLPRKIKDDLLEPQ